MWPVSVSGGGHVDEDIRKLHPTQKVRQMMSVTHEHGLRVIEPEGVKITALDAVYSLLLITIVFTVTVSSAIHVTVPPNDISLCLVFQKYL